MLLLLAAACAAESGPTLGTVRDVVLIGDSLSVSAANELAVAIPGVLVDAAEGRQFAAAPERLTALADRLDTADAVVIALGTNGPIAEADLDSVMQLASGTRVVFVNIHVPRPWESINNAALIAAADRYGAGLVDWKSAAAANGAWLSSDGYHLSGTGRSEWAALVAATLGL